MEYQMVANKCLSPARGGDPACADQRKLALYVCPPHAGVILKSPRPWRSCLRSVPRTRG